MAVARLATLIAFCNNRAVSAAHNTWWLAIKPAPLLRSRTEGAALA